MGSKVCVCVVVIVVVVVVVVVRNLDINSYKLGPVHT